MHWHDGCGQGTPPSSGQAGVARRVHELQVLRLIRSMGPVFISNRQFVEVQVMKVLESECCTTCPNPIGNAPAGSHRRVRYAAMFFTLYTRSRRIPNRFPPTLSSDIDVKLLDRLCGHLGGRLTKAEITCAGICIGVSTLPTAKIWLLPAPCLG